MDRKLEPYDPKKHKPVDTVGGSKATEYLASENSPEGIVSGSKEFWNIPTIWYDEETKEPVFLGGEGNEKAWRQAFIYEKETGKRFPRYKDSDSAVADAKKRSNKGGATNKSLGMAKGGITMMKSKNNKLYEEGGLATDGVDVDPVSGNDVPPGSNAEDVRDDIPAQLSSGEYVVPADVVKYFGVAYFEKLRAKAKAGLEDMEEDGRMGGEPVEEISEGVSDEDLMKLDGYATGGMVMKDSEVNGIIDRVKAAAKSDPSVSNLLKAKGIYMKDDDAGPKVKGQAGPRKFNVGGTTDLNATGTTSSYNPYTYTPGFSVESGSTGTAPTVVGAPITPTPVAPIATAPAPAPIQCPEGYVLDPATNSCIPISSGRSKGKSVEHDPEAWMKKYDYTDPAVLMEQSLDTLNMGETDEEQNFLEKAAGAVSGFFDKGIFGKIFKTQKHAEVLANAAVLESHGYTDQAAKLREAAGGYAESNKLKLGGFFDSTTTLTKMAMGAYGQTEMMKGNYMPSASSKVKKADESPDTDTRFLKSSGKEYRDAGLGLARKMKDYSPSTQAAIQTKIDKGDARGTSWKGGKVAANQSKPGQTTSKSTSGPAGQGMPSSSKPKSVAERKASASKKYGGLATGGRATGGLVNKKTKLKRKGLAAPNKK